MPETAVDVLKALEPQGTIARGLGRSYGDAALNSGRTVIDCSRMNRYLAFDPERRTLTCEAGLSLAQLITDFAPRGFFPMVTPGTKRVTIGGCIANDVHGKGHHVDGAFVRGVVDFTIQLADGRVLLASREHNADLFWANFGGMGLLGIILTATLRLRPIETTWFKQRPVCVNNLNAMLDALHAHDHTHPYSVAWIDPRATGKHLGRGILTVGERAKRADLPEPLRNDALCIAPPPKLKIPFDLPSFSLNALTAPPLNSLISYVQRNGAPFAHYEKFFFPLDVIDEWNRGYGRRGFTQYQFVVPLEKGRKTIRELLERIIRSRWLPFLNVLKKFGPDEPQGVLSFPLEGYTFAIDFPIRDGIGHFLHELDQLVLDAGGRVYLGKDAFLRRETFEAMYREKLVLWRAIKAKYDPENQFSSDLGRRLGLCPE